LLWFGFDAIPSDPLEVVLIYFMLMIFSFSLGIIFCVLGNLFKEADKFLSLLMMPLMFISCVMYPRDHTLKLSTLVFVEPVGSCR
jgi:capsular polysaccharide transport system permease protein